MVVARTELSAPPQAKSTSFAHAENVQGSLVTGYDDPTASLATLYNRFNMYQEKARTLLAEIDKQSGKTYTDPLADSFLIERFARMHVLLPKELLRLRARQPGLSSLPEEEQVRFKALQDAAKLQEKREQAAKKPLRRSTHPTPVSGRQQAAEVVA